VFTFDAVFTHYERHVISRLLSCFAVVKTASMVR
jgi:hypothetical protein